MKILYCCPTFYPENSGYANAFLGLLSAIENNYTDKDLSIEVVALNHCSIVENPIKYKIHSYSKRETYFLQWLIAFKLKRLIKHNNFDFIFFETLEYPLIVYLLSLFFKNKLIIRLHATTETEHFIYEHKFRNIVKRNFIKHFLSRKIKYISATSSYHIDFYKKHYLSGNLFNIASKNFFVIPNTIFGEAKIINLVDKLKNKKPYSEKIKLILLGRQNLGGVSQKGFLDFIYAFNLLRTDLRSKFDITIIGDGSEHERLLYAARNLKQIKFVKKMTNEETISSLILSDVSVLVSRFEGLSMFALESLLCETAVLFTKTGGLVDLMEQNGVFVRTQDIEQIARALEYFANLTKDEMLRLNVNSKIKYMSAYSNVEVAHKFYAILNLIIES